MSQLLDKQLHIVDHGSIVMVKPMTPEAKSLFEEKASGPEHLYHGDYLAVEHRYIEPLLEALWIDLEEMELSDE